RCARRARTPATVRAGAPTTSSGARECPPRPNAWPSAWRRRPTPGGPGAAAARPRVRDADHCGTVRRCRRTAEPPMTDAIARHAALDKRLVRAARGIRLLGLASRPRSVQPGALAHWL